MKPLKLLPVLLCLSLGLQAQYAKSKLTVAKNEILEISESDIRIDTLIMKDKGQIVFLAPETKLVIKNAIIGKNCIWDASGKSGKLALQSEGSPDGNSSADGLPGRSLDATVTFRQLGKLNINANGALGSQGREGGERGGDGGAGGNLSIKYGTSFPITFNEGRSRSIYVNNRGGRGGFGGRPEEAVSQTPPRNSSHNAGWDLWGTQKSANASGGSIASIDNSRAANGGVADIPQPRFVSQGSEGVEFGGVNTGPSQDSQGRAVSNYGQSGRPGMDGRFLLQRIE